MGNNLNYQKLGLKCGIEIHQQLDTKKLFCECPSEIREDTPDTILKRKMRVVSGELGDVDPAALYEFLKDKEFIYEAYSNTNCLVELDEEPPHFLNQDALDIALEISFLLNAKPISELQVMRKTVIDGSNTSGFQRTVLIAMDGFLETSLGKVGIPTICLEEDAARKIREEGNTVTYRLDRLGIPLVEICTSPEIKNPEHAREVAEKLGMILRATGKVKRGIGTIRQDVNISIFDGERIEIKGVQELRLISKVVELEVKRQLMLIEVKNELEKRNVEKENLKENFLDVSEIFENTKSEIIKKTLEKNGGIIVMKLNGFSGLLKGKLGPELAQYAKISGVQGILHSDELPNYGISQEEVLGIRKKLNLNEKVDAFVLVAENKDIAKKALREVIKRAKLAFHGVPKETRKANEDGITEFTRPLPGTARMYPETDEPLIEVTEEKILKIKEKLPKLPEDKLKEFLDIGLGEELAKQLLKSKFGDKFLIFTKKFQNLKPSIIATTLISTPKEIKRRYNVEIENLKEEHYEKVLEFADKEKITKEAIPEILAELSKNPKKDIEKILEEKNLWILSEKEIEKIVEKIIRENSEYIKKMNKEKAVNFTLGKSMAILRGRCNPNELRKIIEEKLK